MTTPACRTARAVEDVILNRRDDGTERLLDLAEKYRGSKTGKLPTPSRRMAYWDVKKASQCSRW